MNDIQLLKIKNNMQIDKWRVNVYLVVKIIPFISSARRLSS